MDETKRAWDEVGEGFVKLGRIISERYKNLGEERASQSDPADDRGVAEAIRRATEELDKAFTSLGDTLRDKDSQVNVRETGRKLSDAIKVTFTEVSDEVRRAVGNRRSSGTGDASPGDEGDSAQG
jgi:hypothetical protein